MSPQLGYYATHRVVPACMGFCGRPAGDRFEWAIQGQFEFRIEGLICWGVTNASAIHAIRIGNSEQLVLSDESGFPARFFEAGMSLADFGRLLEPSASVPSDLGEGKTIVSASFLAWMKTKPEFKPHQLMSFPDVLSPGVFLSITCSGPIEALAFWGAAIR